jgi:hypothetical protein
MGGRKEECCRGRQGMTIDGFYIIRDGRGEEVAVCGGLETVEEFERRSDKRLPLKCPRKDLGQGPVRQHNRPLVHDVGAVAAHHGCAARQTEMTDCIIIEAVFSRRSVGVSVFPGGAALILFCLCIDSGEGWTPSSLERPTLMSSRG